MFGANNIVTGLDIGVGSVKAVRLRHGRGPAELLGLSIVEIDGETAGDPPEHPSRREAIIEAVRKTFEALGVQPTKVGAVASAVGGPNVSVKELTFPSMRREKFAESLQYEARRHVPFEPADVILDFQVFERADRDKDGQMRVLLGAAKKSVIERHVGILGEVGVEPFLVDLEPLALLNEADAEGLVNSRSMGVIEIGSAAANITAYRRGAFFFARSIPLRAGLGAQPKDSGWLRVLIEEARVSLSYFDNRAGKDGIETLCLSGGRSLGEGVVDAFSDALGVKTALLDPLASVAETSIDVGELRKQGPRFAMAFGLARRRG